MNPRTVVILVVGFFLMSILGPIALLEIADANTTGWNSTVITIFQTVLPILFVIGIAIRYIPGGKK